MSIAELFIEQADPSWHKLVKPEILQRINDALQPEFEKYTIYPPKDKIFHVFSLLPYDKVEVVILGQDPYIREGQAMGMAFSVPNTLLTPPSLNNIFLELPKRRPNDLTDWVNQGVFLFNTTLTVREGQSDSHKGIWSEFTSAIISSFCESPKYIIFAIWGKKAYEHVKEINRDKDSIIESSHPSPLSYKKTMKPFSGSRPFNKINTLRKLHNLEPIKWVPE